jgi:hypothetical protein
MKIFQVTYKATIESRVVYYRAEKETDITINTAFYKNFIDCREQNNKFMMGLEPIRVKEALIRSFLKK